MSTDAWGIDETYEDAGGNVQRISPERRDAIRDAMGTPPAAAPSLFQKSVLVLRQGETLSLPKPAQLTLEDGTAMRLRDTLPADLPLGYHQLTALDGPSGNVRLIVSPGRCHLPSDLQTWGWSAQVYATRSQESWGIGDLADLRRLTEWGARLDAGMVLINPLDAATPVSPLEPSPYSPSSRRYLNPLYLRIEELPGAAGLGADLQRLATLGRALNDDRRIDRDQVFRLKQEALDLLWGRFRGDAAFDRYRDTQGKTLRQFAVFCVLAEQHGKDWRQWPMTYRRPDSPDIVTFVRDHDSRVQYHEWLQWLLDRQLARASESVRLMQDLPVGFSPDGADAWTWQDLLAMNMTVGAPPDLFSVDGQDWGLPPFIPHKLAAAGYEPFIQTIRAALRHGGGLRIDHVMGLFRLWWTPQGRKPKEGAYVRYPADDLLAIVALESRRAQAIVVGEDLGTVEQGVRERLSDHDILSYRLLWFEEQPPPQYPAKALAAVSTHDLPTLAGVWTGADLRTQRRLGLNPDESKIEELHRKVQNVTGLEETVNTALAIQRTYERLAEAPSAIVMASLDDACQSPDRPNMPGAAGKYPNWSMALPVPLERLESAALPQTLAHALDRQTARATGKGASCG
ncbi:MAG TPA: 4-alpha-glucanotransferase [Nitrospiraceae bacterium]|nr:4-alpha-glucanotransferase [Nitrospiraceae bacterium]